MPSVASAAGRYGLLAGIVLAACAGAPPASSDDEFMPETSERGTFVLEIRPEEGGFRRGVNALTIAAFTRDGRPAVLREVRARMPGHAHDEARATLRAVAGGWRAEGLALTMPGRWWITLRVADGTAEDEATAITSLR